MPLASRERRHDKARICATRRFADSPLALWLPKEVEVNVDYGGYVFSNRHTYSDYRMFRANSVIKAAGPGSRQH